MGYAYRTTIMGITSDTINVKVYLSASSTDARAVVSKVISSVNPLISEDNAQLAVIAYGANNDTIKFGASGANTLGTSYSYILHEYIQYAWIVW